MLRFLRKNEKLAKWTLVVGMVLLLISWLVADGSTQLVQFIAMSGTRWATVDGQKVTRGDLDRVQREMRLIDVLKDRTLAALEADKNPAQWYLLSHEAEQCGLVGGVSDGARTVAMIAAQQKVPEAQVIGTLAGQSGLGGKETLMALSRIAGVKRLVALTTGAPALSDARLKQNSAEMLLGVSGQVVVLDARKPETLVIPEAADERLEQHLTQYGEKTPAATGVDWGYRLGDRVQIEWLQVPADSVRSAVEQSNAMSSVELRKYFMAHTNEFGPSQLGATAPNFEGMREQVKAKVLSQLTREKMSEIGKFIADRLQMSLRGVPQRNGLYELPADGAVKQESFATLAAEVAERFDVPQPTLGGVQDHWLTAADIDALPTLGKAMTDKFGRNPVRASQFAAALSEFGGSSTIPAQVAVASPVFVDEATGSVCVFRVTAAEASHAPKDLEEVRTQVAADVQAIDRFAALTAETAAIQTLAAGAGLTAVAEKYGSKVEIADNLREADPRFLSYGVRVGSQIPGVGNDPKLLAQIVQAAMALPTGGEVSAIPADQRTFVFDAPAALSVIVFRVDTLTPMTRDDFARLAPAGGLRGASQQAEAEGADPAAMFSFAALSKRHNFELARDSEDEAKPESKPEPAPEPAKVN